MLQVNVCLQVLGSTTAYVKKKSKDKLLPVIKIRNCD